ncbi:hypothetical protein CHARACLAT_006464 [Characodon lateralis]|uniref:Uncharacterized protein n=1 Tax=Characodon lateralis TaxID=208331 RepID=A0ABU7DNX3_9TELE|nr:hypothetical protein [Characodon lateralis]
MMVALLELPVMSKVQLSSCWFELNLKNSEVVLPLHYFTHFVQGTSVTGSSKVPEYDATTMLDSWYNVFSFENLTLNYPNIDLGGQTVQSLSKPTVNIFSRRYLGCSHGLLQISVGLEGVGVTVWASFLVGTITVCSDTGFPVSSSP